MARGPHPGDGLVTLSAVVPARNAVATAFAVNGLLFASLVSRVPDVRSGLDLSNGALGLLLLAIAAGSVLTLPTAGWFIERTSAAWVVRAGALLTAAALVVAALGAAVVSVVPLAAAGLFAYGVGSGLWDVAMNVEGAEVERRLGRAVMPRFHAGFSLGTILGAGIGVVMTAGDVPMLAHLAGVVALGVTLVVQRSRAFLPAEEEHAETGRAFSAWTEPRTVALGAMVLCFAVAEGSASDWLSLALIDGYDVEHWVGVTGYAVFVTAMTVGRFTGTTVLDRFGRAPTLAVSSAMAAAGVLLVVLGEHVLLVGAGILMWGLGASLGFPVGMSAAGDDPVRAAARVSVVSTIGYSGFLAGPPLLGSLGDVVGTLESLLAVAVLMGPALLAVLATRRARAAAVGPTV